MRQKRIFTYPDIKGDPIEEPAKQINGYLVDASMVFINSRARPREGMPELSKGSQPTDGGYLILTPDQAEQLRRDEPETSPFIRPYMGGAEFLNARERYCLWLKEVSPQELRKMPLVLKRLEGVREARLKSPTASVRDFASQPALFTQDRQPEHVISPFPRFPLSGESTFRLDSSLNRLLPAISYNSSESQVCSFSLSCHPTHI